MGHRNQSVANLNRTPSLLQMLSNVQSANTRVASLRASVSHQKLARRAVGSQTKHQVVVSTVESTQELVAVGSVVEKPSPKNERELMLQKLRDRVNAGKHYHRPTKQYEMKANNPFFNGALAVKYHGLHTSSPSQDLVPSLDKMLAQPNYFSSQESTQVAVSQRSVY